MGRNKYLILIIACVTLLAAASAPRAANAADYTPEPTFPPVTSLPNAPYVTNLAVELDSYGYPVVSWSPIYGYTYDVFRSSNNNISTFYYVASVENSWYTDLNVSSAGTLYYRIRVRQGDGAGRLSSSVSITMSSPPLPTPTPTPPPTPTPTPDPFYYSPTAIPLPPAPTTVPVPLPSLVQYNYFTANNTVPNLTFGDPFFTRDNFTGPNRPLPISANFVGSSMTLPINFSSSEVYNPSIMVGFYYAVVDLDLTFAQPLNDLYYVSLSYPLSVNLYEPVTDYSLNGEAFIKIYTSDNEGSAFVLNSSAASSLRQIQSGITVALPLDSDPDDGYYYYKYRIELEIPLNDYAYVTGEPVPFYLSGRQFSFDLHGLTYTPDIEDSVIIPVEIGNQIQEHTSAVGRFFSSLWNLLFDAFRWLGRLIVDGFDLIGIRLDVLINRLSVWFSDTMATIRTAASDVIDFTGRLFIPSADDFTNAIARIRNTIEPEEGSLLAFPHQVELELFTILSRDYSTEPEPLTLQEFQINIQGQNYTIFPRTEIRLSTIFPYDLHRYVRFFGDLTLGVWVLYLVTNKVRKLLNLWYSED